MSNYVLSCCSTADLPLAHIQSRHIPFICFHYTMDGQDYPDDLGQTMSFEVFYDRIAKGAMPTTSQVNVGEYVDFFEPFLNDGKDILHISLSSGLSGSYSSAVIARDELAEKYPERSIFIVDSLGASAGYGLLVDSAADLRDAGTDIKEAFAWLEENKLSVHHWFFSTDLTHYKRGGRLSPAAASIGTLLNICPLMNLNTEGKLVPRFKIHGKKHVITEMVRMMEIHAAGGLEYAGKCFVSHSACYEDARAVAELVESRFLKLKGPILINSVGAVIGSHTGPGSVAIFFFGDKRSN